LSAPTGKKDADEARAGIAIAAAIATATIVGIGLSLTNILISVRLEQAGYSARAIGINTAASGLASIATAPFVPRLARPFGVRAILLVSLAVGTLCLAVFAVTSGYWTWLAIRVVASIALTVLFVLSEFWINAATPASRRGLIMGIYTASLAAGFAAGPLPLALTGPEGIAPFGMAVLLFALAALPVSLVGVRAPELAGPANISVLHFLIMAPAAALAAIVYGGIENAAFTLLPIFALRSGLDVETSAGLVSLFALGNVAFQIPIGLLSDRTNRRMFLVAIAGFGACAAMILPFFAAAHFAAFCALLFVWSGIVGGLYAVGLAHLGARYRGAELASANATYIMLYCVGMLVAPPILGAGLDVAPAGLFFGLGGMLGLYFCIAGWRSFASRGEVSGA
jgi:MFS family permease